MSITIMITKHQMLQILNSMMWLLFVLDNGRSGFFASLRMTGVCLDMAVGRHPEPFACAQGKLREGSASGSLSPHDLFSRREPHHLHLLPPLHGLLGQAEEAGGDGARPSYRASFRTAAYPRFSMHSAKRRDWT